MIYAYPTEGVWGLGCLPNSEEDVKKICFLKQRTLDKGLILVSGHFSHFDPYLSHLPEEYMGQKFDAYSRSKPRDRFAYEAVKHLSESKKREK